MLHRSKFGLFNGILLQQPSIPPGIVFLLLAVRRAINLYRQLPIWQVEIHQHEATPIQEYLLDLIEDALAIQKLGEPHLSRSPVYEALPPVLLRFFHHLRIGVAPSVLLGSVGAECLKN
jgi:hypothetical protein